MSALPLLVSVTRPLTSLPLDERPEHEAEPTPAAHAYAHANGHARVAPIDVEPIASRECHSDATRQPHADEAAAADLAAAAAAAGSLAAAAAAAALRFSDPEQHSSASVRFPQRLIPADFSHVQLVFRSRNTLLFRARRRVLVAMAPATATAAASATASPPPLSLADVDPAAAPQGQAHGVGATASASRSPRVGGSKAKRTNSHNNDEGRQGQTGEKEKIK